ALKSPDIVNREPFGKGWLIKVQLLDPSEIEKLMDSGAYGEMTAGGH
ncbi:MAG: glycine cleavage system protein H, partial [Chloroflexi bacterium]|nr:glycine cleavage system protein H [Chloroflexota bacterium]